MTVHHPHKGIDMEVKSIAVLAATALLCACTPSVEALVEDPELMQKTSQTCVNEMMQGKEQSQPCKNWEQAVQKTSANLMQGLFGQ